MKKIVTVSDLSVQFGEEMILKDINFSVNEHDVVIVLGPNGAGKSTLFKAMLGLIPHTGIVEWNTKKIGYLPAQELMARTYLPPLTVRDFFSFKNAPEKDIIDLLNEVDFPLSLLDHSFVTLSTGQFQRMMLAWILIDKPSVLLLDEPMAGIDITGAETIYDLLHKLWKKWKLTILLITHDISVIWKHATNVLCLNKKLICYGHPEQTLTPELLKKVYGTEVSLYEHRHPTGN